MSATDFNLGPFGIDAATNRSTCLGAFFDLSFGSGSRVSWVVSILFVSSILSSFAHSFQRLTDRRFIPQERLLSLSSLTPFSRIRFPLEFDSPTPVLLESELYKRSRKRRWEHHSSDSRTIRTEWDSIGENYFGSCEYYHYRCHGGRDLWEYT